MPNSPSSQLLHLRPQTHWRKPTTCSYKVNYDGAVFAETAEAGIGVIVRNAYGKPMATLSQKIRFPLSVEATEAMAARRAVRFALELGLTEVEFEGDSRTINDALNGEKYTHKQISGLSLKTQRPLHDAFHKHLFLHVKRMGNSSCPCPGSQSQALQMSK
jgi:ribonuclease HI